jgi:hypothetical protein
MQRATIAAVDSGLGATISYLRGAASIGLGTTAKNLQRATSGASSSGLGITFKYMRRTTSAAADNGPGTTISYLRGAASIGLGSTANSCNGQ